MTNDTTRNAGLHYQVTITGGQSSPILFADCMMNHRSDTAEQGRIHGQPVAHEQYVVSDTRCPSLHYCKLEWEEAEQQPQRGQSPLEYRGTFFCSSVHLCVCPCVPPGPLRLEICPLRLEICPFRPWIYPLRPGICLLMPEICPLRPERA